MSGETNVKTIFVLGIQPCICFNGFSNDRPNLKQKEIVAKKRINMSQKRRNDNEQTCAFSMTFG